MLPAEDGEKLLSTCVPAAQDQRHPFPAQLLVQPESSRQRRRTCRLDQVACRLDHQRLRRADLVVAYEDEVVE